MTETKRCARRLALLTIAALAGFLVARPADAALPGENGDVVTICGSGICSFSAGGAVRTKLTGNINDYDPSYTPDGRRIIFTRNPKGPRPQGLFVMRRDGESIRQIAPGRLPGALQDPSPTPDDERVVVASEAGIFSVGLDGSDVTQLTEGRDIDPAISPDGRTIAFLRPQAEDAGSYRLWVMDADGSDQKPITESAPPDDPTQGVRIGSVDYSPDGERLLIDRLGARNEGPSGTGAFLISPDGSGLEKIPGTTDSVFEPTFSPDGTRFAFKGRRTCNAYGECGPALTVRSLDGGPRTTLGPIGTSGTRSLDWGPAPRRPPAAGTCGDREATIVGTGRADDITGTPSRDVIAAGSGRDRIRGLGGSDVICGGPGGDRMDGGPGEDLCSSGARVRSCERD